MEKRIQARTNNYQLDSLVRRKPWGYGFIEERHFDSAYIFIALDLTGMVYEIDPAKAKVGPAIFRCGDIRGKCDQQPMMYVNETGVKFLYRSKFRPGQANSTQTFTSVNRLLEEQMVKEYVQWRSGEYLPPTYSKRVGTHLCMDDGGIRIKI